MRNGRLLESDWPKISHAIGRLGEAPLYIDDNPNLTIMEVRAKARRLKSRLGGLGLIVIDYLQLMTGRARPRTARSRWPRSAAASRSWPASSRCPVVALSQLSRNLESRADKRPHALRPPRVGVRDRRRPACSGRTMAKRSRWTSWSSTRNNPSSGLSTTTGRLCLDVC